MVKREQNFPCLIWSTKSSVGEQGRQRQTSGGATAAASRACRDGYRHLFKPERYSNDLCSPASDSKAMNDSKATSDSKATTTPNKQLDKHCCQIKYILP